MVILLVSILYCVAVLCITYCMVYNKLRVNLQNILAFGAGFLSVLVLFEFLPNALKTSTHLTYSILLIVCGFLVQVVAEIWLLPKMTFLNRFFPEKHSHSSSHPSTHVHSHLLPSSLGCSATACFVLCAFFDGIRLNSGFLINPQTTALISLGLLFHLLPESITVVGIGLSSGFSRKSSMGVMLLFCLSFLAGSLSLVVLSQIKMMEMMVLSFASGLFIYVCAVHLIPVAWRLKKIKWFCLGCAVYFILFVVFHGAMEG